MEINFLNKKKKKCEDGYKSPYRCYLKPEYFPSLAHSFCHENISDKYQKLIEGLDKKSIRVISRVINRIREYEKTKVPYFDLSKEEYELLADVLQWQKNEVVLFEGKYHRWDKYIVEWNSFYENVFYHKHHVNELNNWDKKKDIIDVGAYTGESSLVLSEFLEEGAKVHAFEASKMLFDMTNNTMKLNNINNVVTINCALSDKNEDTFMYDGYGFLSRGGGGIIKKIVQKCHSKQSNA